MTFDEFEDTARDLFGLTHSEVGDFAETLDQAGLPLEEWDADDETFWEIASDLTDEFFEDIEQYDLDPYFPGDEYLDAGIEWEMTAETDEGYGDD